MHAAALRIGRGQLADIDLADGAVSVRHARVTRTAEGFHVRDLGSRNGTFVNGQRIEQRRQLLAGDRLQVGDTVLKFSLPDALEERALTGLFELTVRDPLTQAYNRRHLMQRLPAALADAACRSQALSVLLVDIDHFKRVNDSHGHAVGDLVLQAVAASLQRALRRSDMLCRFGGEEFAVVAPDTAPCDALVLAERLRRRIEHLGFPMAVAVHATISVGVVTCAAGDEPEPDALLQAADQALYAAKASGRNKVVAGLLPVRETGTPSRRPRPHTIPPTALEHRGQRAPVPEGELGSLQALRCTAEPRPHRLRAGR